jgi:hypothetical protein
VKLSRKLTPPLCLLERSPMSTPGAMVNKEIQVMVPCLSSVMQAL